MIGMQKHHKVKICILFFIVLMSAACAAKYTLIRKESKTTIGNVFTVKSPINWSKTELSGLETWTVDGPQLQTLRFIRGLEDGKPLFDISFSQRNTMNKNMPLFKSSMTSPEIVEFIEISYAKVEYYNFETEDLRPYKFGKLKGFRFEIRFTDKSGLKYKGFMAGAIKDKRLLGIIYFGTSLYHYQKNLKDAEAIVDSVEVI